MVFWRKAFPVLLVGMALGAFAISLPTWAETTSRSLMNLQGRLTDTAGNPTSGDHLFELRIWDSSSGPGTPLYYEAQIITVNSGIYNILVGNGDKSFSGSSTDDFAVTGGKTGGIPPNVFDNESLWLEVEVDQDNPLSPRTRVVSSAYSYRARKADSTANADNAATLGGQSASSFVSAVSGGRAANAVQADNADNADKLDGIDSSQFVRSDTAPGNKLGELTGGSETSLHKHASAATNTPGTIANVVTVQTRSKGSYSGPTSGDGTIITPMTITITPKKAGNMVILDWVLMGEAGHNTAFIVTRNGTRLPDTTNSSNSRWESITSWEYDQNESSTANATSIRIIDYNSLGTQTNYELRVRSSHTGGETFWLNRTFGHSGTNGHEAGLSTGIAWEVWK